MFTITGYLMTAPCLLCNAQNGTFMVESVRNDINGSLCSKCLTRIVKLRCMPPKSGATDSTGTVANGHA